MIGPSLFPEGGSGDSGIAGRVADAETDIASLKSGKATTASVTAVRDRVETLEAAAVAGHVGELRYLGTHAILSGVTFNRAALLAEPFLVGKAQKRLRFDLQLVAGGASGGQRGDTGANLNGSSVAVGGRQGGVRLQRGLRETDLPDGLSISVGAGGASATGSSATGYGQAGGNTRFGLLTALGGRAYTATSPNSTDVAGANDVSLGRPGGFTMADVPSASLSGAVEAAGRMSLGPGAGGGSSNFGHGLGGVANEYDGNVTSRTSTALGGAGASAPAESFRYGTGGNAARPLNGANSAGGAGGFPGGGGGGVLWDTAIGSNPGSGAGGAGVIRIHCYELVEVK